MKNKPKTYLLILLPLLAIFVLNGCSLTPPPSDSELDSASKAEPPTLAEKVLGEDSPQQFDEGSETYEVTDKLTFTNSGTTEVSKIELWFALAQDIDPYQEIISKKITPSGYDEVTAEDGNKYAHFILPALPAGASQDVTLSYQIRANKIFNYLGDCRGNTITDYIKPEQYIESDNPELQSLAKEITAGDANSCEKALSAYDYVTENMKYAGYNPENAGSTQALQNLSGDCNEFTDLFVALNRAAGVPARAIDGYTYQSDPGSGLGDIKHAWAEVYLPGTGWTPVDPTWGRHDDSYENEFSQADGEHMIVLTGRNHEILGGYAYYYYMFWDGDPGAVTAEENLQVDKI